MYVLQAKVAQICSIDLGAVAGMKNTGQSSIHVYPSSGYRAPFLIGEE